MSKAPIERIAGDAREDHEEGADRQRREGTESKKHEPVLQELLAGAHHHDAVVTSRRRLGRLRRGPQQPKEQP